MIIILYFRPTLGYLKHGTAIGLRHMLDLIIVGGGYWGAAIAITARKAGLDVIVFDDDDPRSGSRNASGIADFNAYFRPTLRVKMPPGWTEQDIADSALWLTERGAVHQRGYFWNHFQKREVRAADDGSFYLPSNSILTDQAQAVTRRIVARHDRRVRLDNGTTVEARKLVLALGYRSSELFMLPHVKPLAGAAIVVDGEPRVPLPISIMVAPYKQFHVRRWGDYYRIGDTVGGGNPAYLTMTADLAFGEGQWRQIETIGGYRPVTEQFCVEEIEPGVIVATGGYRVGLGLSGLVAIKVMELIV